ncbi:MAG: quinolinate synthase [Parcubacteria group bacterium]|jgi:quinolinate synthase|nr:quinolinate synthase [Parcubacteria group bacterium]HJN63131.1 quinolinate synthase NadA [Flavobacteriales bacterium]|tara:strand:+ start:241 stop:1167 length:927 start_codon:yes stop_codon:yes gene_type:complete
MDQKILIKRILNLKQEKNAIILAHYYQDPSIQEIADFVGDSLGLSHKAKKTEANIIVFAGVHFMAETAKIINPEKKVILPDMDAGCSLSESCPADKFKEFIKNHPNHTVISYINCSTEIKALSDIICTSSNALRVINSVPKEREIIFAPDKNLGAYLARKSGRELVLWDGTCIVHQEFSETKIETLKKEHPSSKVIAHPECTSYILDYADFIGSTTALLDFTRSDKSQVFIVATEACLLYQMRKRSPEKEFIVAPVVSSCSACQQCPYMQKNTLEKLYQCLKNESPEIIIEEKLRNKAYISVQKMMKI